MPSGERLLRRSVMGTSTLIPPSVSPAVPAGVSAPCASPEVLSEDARESDLIQVDVKEDMVEGCLSHRCSKRHFWAGRSGCCQWEAIVHNAQENMSSRQVLEKEQQKSHYVGK